MTRTSLSAILSSALLLASAAPVRAASTDDLEFFEQEAKVITASRREQTIAEVPVAVDVVTAEEIKASGATNIWDLLRFRVGMDVLDGRSIDGTRAVVSVRGLPQEFTQNVLVLVDGRNVFTPYDNGVYWGELPVQIQDIQRIEIIRGPNTALYGSGAAQGAINIITRKPSGKRALELDNRGGNQGLMQFYQAAEIPAGDKAAVRVTHTYQEQGEFPLASGTAVSGDSLRQHIGQVRVHADLSPTTDAELFAGGSQNSVGVSGEPTVAYNQHYEMVKISHRFTPNSVLEVTSGRNDAISRQVAAFDDVRSLQYDEGILHRLSWWNDRLHTTYGMEYRNTQLDAPAVFRGNPRPRLEIYRGYLHQTWKAADEWSFQGAIALEHANLSGSKPSYEVATIFTPLPQHAFRLSQSVSYTQQGLYPLDADHQPLPSIRLLGDPTLSLFKITSVETGYYGKYLDQRLLTDASLFYTRTQGFTEGRFLSQSFVPPFTTTLRFANVDATIARGVELSVKYRFTRASSVYANYTYEHITDETGNIGQRTGNTPAHKFNFGGMMDLGRGLSASANAGYKDNYFITSEGRSVSVAVPAYWRLDARVAYVLPWYRNAEIYLSGQNLLKPTHVEFADGLAVPRTFAGGLSVKF